MATDYHMMIQWRFITPPPPTSPIEQFTIATAPEIVGTSAFGGGQPTQHWLPVGWWEV